MTILFAPQAFSSVQDLFYTVSDAKASDPVTFPNYKYIADVYINGTMVTRLKCFPDPTFNYGVFNLGKVVGGFIIPIFRPTGSLINFTLGEGQFYASVQVKFGEEYGVTSTYNIVTDSVRKVFNYYSRLLQRNLAPLSDFADKIPTNMAKLNSDLTPFKTTMTTEHVMISYFPTTTTPFTVSVTGVGTYTTTITPTTAFDMIVFNISPAIINILRPGTIVSSLDFYTVTINTETFRVRLFCEPVYNPYYVHFLNQYGGFETVVLNKVSRRNTKVDRKSFGTLPYKVSSAGVVGYYDDLFTLYESDYNYINTFTQTLTLNSDLLNDAEYIWLEDFIESPLVYLSINALNYPVKITNTDYEIRKQINETELGNLTVVLDFGRTFNSQLR